MAKWLPPILPYNNTFHFPLPFVDLSTEGRKTHQSPHGSFLSIDLFLSLLFPRVFPFAKKKRCWCGQYSLVSAPAPRLPGPASRFVFLENGRW